MGPRDVQGGLLTERHLWDENVPSLNELTDTDVCLEWLAAVDGAVKFLAAVERAVVVLCVCVNTCIPWLRDTQKVDVRWSQSHRPWGSRCRFPGRRRSWWARSGLQWKTLCVRSICRVRFGVRSSGCHRCWHGGDCDVGRPTDRLTEDRGQRTECSERTERERGRESVGRERTERSGSSPVSR